MTLIEKVEKAIEVALIEAGAEISHFRDSQMRATARAAIEAMRDPTDEMCAKGEMAGHHAITMWRAMIDVALSAGEAK